MKKVKYEPELRAGIVMCGGEGFGPVRWFKTHRPRALISSGPSREPLFGFTEYHAELKNGVMLELLGSIDTAFYKVDGVLIMSVRCDEVKVLEDHEHVD